MIRRPPRSTQSRSSAASDVYKRQGRRGDAGVDAEERNALVAGEDGGPLWPVEVYDRANLEGVRAETAPGGRVQALHRSAVRGEGLRRRRVVSEPARGGRRLLCG